MSQGAAVAVAAVPMEFTPGVLDSIAFDPDSEVLGNNFSGFLQRRNTALPVSARAFQLLSVSFYYNFLLYIYILPIIIVSVTAVCSTLRSMTAHT